MNRTILYCALLLILMFAGKVLAASADLTITDIQAPVGMIYGKDGALYVSEWSRNRVSRIGSNGRTIVTEAIPNPSGLAFDDEGTLYAASYEDGSIYALASGAQPRRIASGFASPTGMIWEGKALIVANRNAGEIVRVFRNGRKEIVSRGHRTPVGIARLNDGSLAVSCYGGSVDMVSPDGNVSVLTNSLNTPGVGIIPDRKPGAEDAVLVVDYGGTTVQRVTRDGKASPVTDGLHSPVGLARMPDGRVLVGTWGDNAAYAFNANHEE